MLSIHLLEPPSGALVSGGYLYNQRMAECALGVSLHAIARDELHAWLGAWRPSLPALLLFDSLLLAEDGFESFTRPARQAGAFVGVVLHALPSFIARSQQRSEVSSNLPLMPTAQELERLKLLDVIVTPGPFLPRLTYRVGLPWVVCPAGAPSRHAATEVRVPRAVDAPVLISVGRIVPAKGLSDALTALESLPHLPFLWRIVGSLDCDPTYAQQFAGRVKHSRIADRVSLLGALSHEGTQAELSESDCLLLTSYTENAPLVVTEALAAGVPIVGYDVGGVRDQVRHGYNGKLVPLLDLAALVRELESLIRHPGVRQQLARGARAAGTALWSWTAAGEWFSRAIGEALRDTDSGIVGNGRAGLPGSTHRA